MKTCEEYVLKELQKTQQELQLANKKTEERVIVSNVKNS